MRPSLISWSFLRKRESSPGRIPWIPAYAGMTSIDVGCAAVQAHQSGALAKQHTLLSKFSIDEDKLIKIEDRQAQLYKPAGNCWLQRPYFRGRASLLFCSSLSGQLFKEHLRLLALLC